MGKSREKTLSRKSQASLGENTQELILDDIYNSDDPKVKDFLSATFHEEVELAHERALFRVATRFRHLLSPQVQKMLDMRQLPASQVTLG